MDNLNNQTNDNSENSEESKSICTFAVNIEYLHNYIITIEEILNNMERVRGKDDEKYNKSLDRLNNRVLRFAKCYILYFAYKQNVFKHSHIKKLIDVLKTLQIASGSNLENFNIINMLKRIMKYVE